MIDDKIVDDFDSNIKKIEETRDWLDRLYYNPEYANFFNKPILSTLLSGCDYLKSNLIILLDKYKLRKHNE